MAIVTVLGSRAYIGAEIQFLGGCATVTGDEAVLRYGINAAPIETPTTPGELRARYGYSWNIPSDARPMLMIKAASPASSPAYTWLGEGDLILCGTIVEFMRPRSASTRPPAPEPKWKWRWWR